MRSVYIHECSQLLQVEEKLLVQEVDKLMKRSKEEKLAAAEKQRQREAAKAERAQQPMPMPEEGAPIELLGRQAPPPMDGLHVPPPSMEEGGSAGETVPPPPAPFLSEGDEGDATDRVGQPTPLPWEGQGPVGLFIPSQNKQKKIYHEKEVLLMQQLVRYGEQIMYVVELEDGSERSVSVAEHITEDLEMDGLQLNDPMHRQMLNEVIERIHHEGFVASRYFFSHPNPEVARLAADLSSDRYQLSKYHSRSQKIVAGEDRLCEVVPHLLTDLKLAIVEDELKQVLAALQDRTVMTDAARYMEIMKRYKDLSEVQRTIAKRAGDRVVLS